MTESTHNVLRRFSAGHPRGSLPAEEYAAEQRVLGTPAEVVMNLRTDEFHVIVPCATSKA
ncbi:hypothetical protein ABZ468_48810 [Streptomyces sp. NPDC005708]|uniref:hypothetical protein n=1 Tax=Streptomyces sp. NPDC005708 TaxID=3154564 RepID=UPI0033E36A36